MYLMDMLKRKDRTARPTAKGVMGCHNNIIRPASRNLPLENRSPEPVVVKGNERLVDKIDDIL
jgi:hypothetical protein